MSMEARTTAEASGAAKPKKAAYATPATAPFVKGRRAFFRYRDLGVSEASDGEVRAQVISATEGMSKPTGWHYHVCDTQFIYILDGWIALELEDGRKLHMEAGDSLYIPGGMRHNETATSDAVEILEVSVPADLGTVACDPPTR